jgi:hypothetical protein
MHVICDVTPCRLVYSYLATVYRTSVFDVSADTNIQRNLCENLRSQIPRRLLYKINRVLLFYTYSERSCQCIFQTVDRIVLKSYLGMMGGSFGRHGRKNKCTSITGWWCGVLKSRPLGRPSHRLWELYERPSCRNRCSGLWVDRSDTNCIVLIVSHSHPYGTPNTYVSDEISQVWINIF